jgi:hypothetical protein
MTIDELRTRVIRTAGVSAEDADRIITMVGEATMEHYLTTNAGALADTHERDQEDAAIFDITKSVARHFRTLRAEGMGETTAAALCDGFQHALMVGGNATLTLIGAGEDDDE